MSVMDMWVVCDRCSFEYRRRTMKVESSGVLVCRKCYDGRFDLLKHPQNYSARPKPEGLPVPDGRAPLDLSEILVTEDGNPLTTEDGKNIEVTGEVWTPDKSLWR